MSTNGKIIETINVGRKYELGSEEVVAVQDVNLEVRSGQFIAIVGRSGSGKTTLLNLIAGLDQATSGTVLFEGKNLAEMNEKELTEIRRHKIGFVFQSFGLLPLLSAFENVELPLRISGVKSKEREQRARDSLEMVGLTRRSNHRPYELSGGEQQRVAIARAVVTEPPLILADEPTGNLDSRNTALLMELLTDLNNEGTTLILITHDFEIASMSARQITLSDGCVEADSAGLSGG